MSPRGRFRLGIYAVSVLLLLCAFAVDVALYLARSTRYSPKQTRNEGYMTREYVCAQRFPTGAFFDLMAAPNVSGQVLRF